MTMTSLENNPRIDKKYEKISINVSKDLRLILDDLIGKCIAILGIRGSGKTNTAAVIIEELLSHGLPLTIIDIDGEYWGIKEKYEIAHLGKGDVDIEIEPEHGYTVASFSLKRGIPIILDLSGYSPRESEDLLAAFLKGLWAASGKIRKPYFVVLEEAHEFVPQGHNTKLKEFLVKIALRGRKRGLGVILISQRSAKVDKDVLTQAEILFLHRVVHPADLKVYQDILPVHKAKIHRIVPSLAVGECIFYNGSFEKVIRVRERHTFHAGSTPQLEKPLNVPSLKKISEELADEIKRAVFQTKENQTVIERLTRENKRLLAQLEEKEKEIERLKQQISILSNIKVTIDENSHISRQKERSETTQRKNGSDAVMDRLLKNVGRLIDQLSRPAKEIIAILVENEGKEFTYADLSAWTGYHIDTVRRCRKELERLVKIGLIERGKKGREIIYYFKSLARSDKHRELREALKILIKST